MPGQLTISMQQLRFRAGHGWHEEEALAGNEFELNIFIRFTPNATIITNIDQTINYAAAFQVVKEVFSVQERLLETIAMKIAGSLQMRFPEIEYVSVEIRKLSVPITGFEGSVSVNYAQSFK